MDQSKLQDYLPKSRGLFYGGAFHEPKSGEYQETISAVNGKPIAKVAFAGREDTIACLETAQKAFETWRNVPSIERCNLLRKTAQIIRDHADELATLDSWDIGSPKAIMLGECEYAARNLDLFAGLAPAMTGKTYNLTEDMFHHTIREPLGVVARIVAYNHPLLMVAAKLAPAVVVGNAVVMKAAEQAPLSALRFAELIQDVFPPGVVSILCGGKECGEVLSSHPIVKRVTLVGSVPIGRLIARSAADTLKLTTFELGGKNALVAYPDADIPSLVEGIVKGMNWGWCGQSCSSTSRVFLHESLHDKVLDLVIDKIRKEHKPGNPLDLATTMGSLVDGKAIERVTRYVDIGRKEGARVVLGGARPDNMPEELKNGFYFQPTVFVDVKQSHRIAQEEIFGPVMSVLKWTNEDEMWRDVNSVEYGLTGAIYSANTGTSHRAARRMEAGYIWINNNATHFLGIPFGGVKQSGMGREHDLDELLDMTQSKSVHLSLDSSVKSWT